MSENCNIKYTVVNEGEQILEFEILGSSNELQIIDDVRIISFLGSQNTQEIEPNCATDKNTINSDSFISNNTNENKLELESTGATVFELPESRTGSIISETNDSNINHQLSISDNESSDLNSIQSRKRQRKPENWQTTVRNKKYQAGLEFVNNQGKIRPKKQIKALKNCLSDCKFRCATQISESERSSIFNDYYSLEQAGKYSFISRTTERVDTRRKRKSDKISRRKYSFYYYFHIHGNRINVCKQFYLGTLAISQKPVYTVHEKMNMTGTLVLKSEKGTKSSRAIGKDRMELVLDHIKSFPCVESHYCRAKTNKKYLDANLNICKLYDLYKIKCIDSNVLPVTSSYYRFIFNTRFNLDFYKPKSDKCGVCELRKNDASQNQDIEYIEHNNLKVTMRHLKDTDKLSDVPILCFDMQKVITCPRSNIDETYYYSKLNIYNLTAHLSTTKTVYCAIWNEATMGRTGNDIASAFYKILERVVNDNDITNLICWSDSCVPQNKNSHMSYAIQHFIFTHPNIESIEMRFSLPGHSCIQEVDNAHSQIEKLFSKNEFFSPIGVIRLLKTINRKRPYQVIQMKLADFKLFDTCSKELNYKVIPFSSLRMLRFTQHIFDIKYALTYDPENYIEASIRPPSKMTRNHNRPLKTSVATMSNPTISTNNKPVPNHKKLHLEKMFKYMGQQDVEYYKTILYQKM